MWAGQRAFRRDYQVLWDAMERYRKAKSYQPKTLGAEEQLGLQLQALKESAAPPACLKNCRCLVTCLRRRPDQVQRKIDALIDRYHKPKPPSRCRRCMSALWRLLTFKVCGCKRCRKDKKQDDFKVGDDGANVGYIPKSFVVRQRQPGCGGVADELKRHWEQTVLYTAALFMIGFMLFFVLLFGIRQGDQATLQWLAIFFGGQIVSLLFVEPLLLALQIFGAVAVLPEVGKYLLWLPGAKTLIFGSNFGKTGGIHLSVLQAAGVAAGVAPSRAFFTFGFAASVGAALEAMFSRKALPAMQEAVEANDASTMDRVMEEYKQSERRLVDNPPALLATADQSRLESQSMEAVHTEGSIARGSSPDSVNVALRTSPTMESDNTRSLV